MNKITVIGSVSMDMVTQTQNIPSGGETVLGERFDTFPGGKGANQAVAISRLSKERVNFIGGVGEDRFGQTLLDYLKKEYILVDNVETFPVPTGIAQITVYKNDNRIIIIPGANNEVNSDTWTEKEWKVISDSELVIIQNEIPYNTNLNIAKFCKNNNVPVIFNPAPSRKNDVDILELVDFATPNEYEIKNMFPNLSIEDVLARFPNKLIITLGEKGVAYHNGKDVVIIPSIKTDVIDTTGAGDTFNGAFALGIVNRLSIEEAIKFGIIASHLSIQKKGAQGGMPTLTEMEKNKHYEKKWNIK
ncbi:Ribokinase [Pseudolactococcus piscium]|nr:Ribokinase [Lactococcus piscium]